MEKPKKSVGRPTIMTPEVLNKLEEVFAIGGTDKEACFYADISHQTLYDYQAEHPEFVERKEALKERPILKARQTIVRGLDDDKNAQWYLERKRKNEFSVRTETDITTLGKEVNTSVVPELLKIAEEELKKRKLNG